MARPPAELQAEQAMQIKGTCLFSPAEAYVWFVEVLGVPRGRYLEYVAPYLTTDRIAPKVWTALKTVTYDKQQLYADRAAAVWINEFNGVIDTAEFEDLEDVEIDKHWKEDLRDAVSEFAKFVFGATKDAVTESVKGKVTSTVETKTRGLLNR